jgi:hypothetical protein
VERELDLEEDVDLSQDAAFVTGPDALRSADFEIFGKNIRRLIC